LDVAGFQPEGRRLRPPSGHLLSRTMKPTKQTVKTSIKSRRGKAHGWQGVIQPGLAVVLLFLLSCGEMPALREEVFYPQIKQPAVTVKLLQTGGNLAISSNGAFVIRCFPREGEKSIYYASAEMQVKLSGGRMILSEKSQGETETDLWKLSFVPQAGDFWISVNGHPYRGVVEVIRDEDGASVRVLNLLYVEDYVKGVVPAEIGRLNRREIEALKAQAVAARTYSLSRRGQYAIQGYDLEATVADQVYRGVEGEDPLANQAVEATQEEVLLQGGRLVQAYYHANSGGKTEDIKQVWGKPSRSYLKPVEDEEFCSWSDNYNWKETWTAEALRNNIESFLRSTDVLRSGHLGDLLNLRVIREAPSGRVELLEVVTDRGSYRISGDKIRWALRRGSDPNSILPSTHFDLQIQRDQDGSIQRITARGKGNGHGVGMCQTGAIGMARQGYSYKDILTFYYPGTKIVKWN
jgi:stage II sporulation protein D